MASERISGEPVGHVWEGVRERLLAEGWRILEEHPLHASIVGTLALELHDGFTATVAVLRLLDADEEDSTPRVLAAGVLGLDYCPARELTLALTGYAYSGVALCEPSLTVDPADERAINEASEALTRFAGEQAPALSRLADIDTMIAMLRERRAVAASEAALVLETDDFDETLEDESNPELELIPALLAAAGRNDEARRVLGENHPHDWPHAETHDRRFVRALTRWVEHEGELSLPTTPAQWPAGWARSWPKTEREPPANILQGIAAHWPSVQARQQAIDAVRRASEGKNREQLRTMLKEQMRTREVDIQPVEMEQTIERLTIEREPLGKARVVLRALGALRESTRASRRLIEDSPAPEWTKTPARAAYPIHLAATGRIAVQLDPTAERSLHELMPDSVVGQMRRIRAWLAPEGEPPSFLSIGVYIGSRRVGTLDAEAAERFRPVLEAAAERDEDASAEAHLTRPVMSDRYVLDLPAP